MCLACHDVDAGPGTMAGIRKDGDTGEPPMPHLWMDKTFGRGPALTMCRICGFLQNENNIDAPCRGNPGVAFRTVSRSL